MRILVLSDIHANLTAFQAVLQAAGSVDATWCLGDVVGYGPDPNECVNLLRALPNMLCVRGNHDQAISSNDSVSDFNREAAQSVQVSRKLCTDETRQYLAEQPLVVTTGLATLVHGSLQDPVWEYILDVPGAIENFALLKTRICFIGHSHLPLVFTADNNGARVERSLARPGAVLSIPERAILNPGSVGQPRDNDPRAAYGIFDPEAMTWEVQRVEYDIPAVQERILKAGFPEKEALRLSAGW